MKDLKEVLGESTCLKRATACEIRDREGNTLSFESNRCNPPEGKCARVGMIQGKAEYPSQSSCNWEHAEIRAIKALPEGSKPYRAILYGHLFFCNNCEDALRRAGCEQLDIAS